MNNKQFSSRAANDFEPTCLCGQGLISFGFGAIIGLVGLLMTNSAVLTAIVQAAGIAFGMQGVEQENPCDISLFDFGWVAVPAFMTSGLFLVTTGTESLFAVVVSAALATVAAYATKIVLRVAYLKSLQQNSSNTNDNSGNSSNDSNNSRGGGGIGSSSLKENAERFGEFV